MRSDMIKRGDARAAHRSLLRATGVGEMDWDKPFIAICNSHVDIIPGHVHLQAVGNFVKECVRAAGGMPFLFNTIGVDDGIAMGHGGMKFSLPSRELIADSVETMIQAHCFDAMICIPNCDKIVPGMFMGAMRVNVPTIFVSGGPMEAGRTASGKIVDLIDAFVAGVQKQNGKITAEELEEIEKAACPDLRELLGDVHGQQHELPGRGPRHGPAGQRDDPGDLGRPQDALRTRRAADRGDGQGLRQGSGRAMASCPARSPAPSAFDNAMILDMAMGGSTNTVLHILAIAHEAGVPFKPRADRRPEQQDAEHLQGQPVEPLSCRGRRAGRRDPHDPRRGRAGLSRTARPQLPDGHGQDPGREHRRSTTSAAPNAVSTARLLTKVRPGGERSSQAWTVPSVAAEARSQAAGLALLEAEGEFDGDEADSSAVRSLNGPSGGGDGDDGFDPFDVIRTVDNAYSQTGGLSMLSGNLAPKGAVVKTAGVSPKMLTHSGPAVIFESEDRRL